MSGDGNTSEGSSVLGSSTFRQALGVVLVVWVLSALGVWAALHHDAAESPEERRQDIQRAKHEGLSALAVAAIWEQTVEKEEPEPFDDLEAEEPGVEDPEEEEWDPEAKDEDDEADDEGDEEGEDDDEARFEAADWTEERAFELLSESDELWRELEEMDLCWSLIDRDGFWRLGSFYSVPNSGVKDSHDASMLLIPGVEVEDHFEDDLRLLRDARSLPAGAEVVECLMAEEVLADGSRLRMGRQWERPELGVPLIASLALLLLALAVAVGGSWLLARRTVSFVSDLRSARARLEGDAFPRLRRPGDGGDFDRAAGEINRILDRLDSALGSLTHVTDNIAHDLRTPLTRLQGQLDVVRRSGSADEPMLAAVQEEADQLVATFNALLRIAQVESGSRRRGFRPFDLAQVVSDVGELYAPAFADAELAFELRSPAAPLRLQGDPDLWMQALSNLLDNALKYTPPGGAVQLDLIPGPPPRIVLRDSGPGIPEDEHGKVFERFYRSQRRPRSGPRGTGLGLSLVAAICELHGAVIRLENDDGLVVRIVFRR